MYCHGLRCIPCNRMSFARKDAKKFSVSVCVAVCAFVCVCMPVFYVFDGCVWCGFFMFRECTTTSMKNERSVRQQHTLCHIFLQRCLSLALACLLPLPLCILCTLLLSINYNALTHRHIRNAHTTHRTLCQQISISFYI